jgi:hypothetical protein
MIEPRDSIKITNTVTIEHRRNGELLYREEGKNLVTDDGFAWIAQQMGGTLDADSAHWIALTGNTTAVDHDDATLTAEYADADGMDRAVASFAWDLPTKTFTLSKTFTKGAAAAKTPGKTAVFSAAAAGTYVMGYLITSPPAMIEDDTIAVVWSVVLS